METNWFILGIFFTAFILLILFLIRRNQKDKKELEDFLSNDTAFIDKEDSEVNDD